MDCPASSTEGSQVTQKQRSAWCKQSRDSAVEASRFVILRVTHSGFGIEPACAYGGGEWLGRRVCREERAWWRAFWSKKSEKWFGVILVKPFRS